MAKHYNDNKKGRQAVSWDVGTFLVFIGTLIRMACTGYPNMTWHFKWPDHLPADLAPVTPLTKYMSLFCWKRYWQYFSTPNFNGAESAVEGDGS